MKAGQEWQHYFLITKAPKAETPDLLISRPQISVYSSTPCSFSPTHATLRDGRSESRQSGRSEGAEKPQNGAVDGT